MKSTKRIISIILALLIVSYIFAMHSIATDVPKDESCETETTRAFTTGSLDVIKTTNPEYRITTMPDITTTKGKVTNPSCRPSKDCFNVTIVPEKYSYSWNEKVVFKINIKNAGNETLYYINSASQAGVKNVFTLGADKDSISELNPGDMGAISCEYTPNDISSFKRFFSVASYLIKRFFAGTTIDTETYPYICTVKVGNVNCDFGFKVTFFGDNFCENADEIVQFYNVAHKTTHPAPKGHSTLKLVSPITGDGAISGIINVVSPMIRNTLERNSVETDYIPGKGELKVSDIVRAKTIYKGEITEIVIQLKDQVDGPDADSNNGGSVARGIGTLGNVDKAIESLDATLYSGKQTIKLTYKDAYIKCQIDNSTGKIIGGTWHYAVHVYVGEAEVKLWLNFTAKNLKGIVDYTVTI